MKSLNFFATIHGMDSKRLDLNLLVTLEALLTERNVTKAAARVHLSQPAVSAQLNRLRELFGDPLLVPAQRGMMPTAKAMELLEPLRESLQQVRATVDSTRQFNPLTTDFSVTIACTDYLQSAIVKPLLLDLRNKAPGVSVAVKNLDPTILDAQMSGGEVDLALMIPQAAPPNLRTRHVFDERYVLIGRRDHPKLRADISLEDFCQLEHVIVSLRGAFVTPVDDTLASLGYKRNVVFSAPSFLVVPEIIAQSDLVALVPERLIRDRSENLQLVECPFSVAGFAVGIVWHERAHHHAGQRWLRDMIVSIATSA